MSFDNSSSQTLTKIKVPNFQKLHEQFYQSMYEKKTEFIPSKSKGFDLKSKVRQKDFGYLDEQNKEIKLNTAKSGEHIVIKAKKFLSKQPKIIPVSTKKFDSQVALVCQKMAQSRERLKVSQQETKGRQEQHKKMQEKMNNDKYFDGMQKQRKYPDIKGIQLNAERKIQYDQWILERKEIGANQPYLIHREIPREKVKKPITKVNIKWQG